jgi:hypothetical protein
MPSKSKQQFKFFKAMEENPALAKERGVSPKVAHEFTQGMTKRRWSKLKDKISKKD